MLGEYQAEVAVQAARQAGMETDRQESRQACGEQGRHSEVASHPAEVSQGDRRSWSARTHPRPLEPHATLASSELTEAGLQEAERKLRTCLSLSFLR